jgi:hypothetical protein
MTREFIPADITEFIIEKIDSVALRIMFRNKKRRDGRDSRDVAKVVEPWYHSS